MFAQTPMPTCTELSTTYTDRDDVNQDVDIDKNNNGLIEICDLEGLNEIRNNPSGTGTEQRGCPSTGCRGFELTKDLDFNSTSSYGSGNINTAWTMGDGWQPIATFNTEFNGNGYTISNLYINRNSTDGVGLFGAIGSSSVIKAVGLLNADIRGRNEVGSLVGESAGGIDSSYATGIVEGSGSVGGLVGENGLNATITNSCATSTVEGSGSVGGLVGHNLRGTITNSCATGTVLGSGSNIGGLVGHNEQETIRNSYATGSVSGFGSDIGGLVGFNDTATIENSYATGDVKGGDSSSNVGGLVGQNGGTNLVDSEIKNSYATGFVSGGGSRVGGLVGWNDTGLRGMITDSYWLRGSASSGGTGVDASTSKTAMELISPTAAEGIYSRWNPDDSDDWDFGTSNQFPTIRNSGSDVLTNLPLCTLNIPNADADDVKHAMDIDKDNNGLIEICDLEGLDEMRHQLDGSGYKTTAGATVITDGCPSDGCIGFELMRDLDFKDRASYRLGSINQAWTSGAGWDPIGVSEFDGFRATFDGNDHTISNLLINRPTDTRVGFFRSITTTDTDRIDNVRLKDVDVTGRFGTAGLAGENFGIINNAYVSGTITGTSNVGGLVGNSFLNCLINNSYAIVTVSGGTGTAVGGLVGINNCIITNSYAIADVSGNEGVGGLVGGHGFDRVATIRNSFAIATVRGNEFVGGLVGGLVDGRIFNSYARGSVFATDTDAGGLVGSIFSPLRPMLGRQEINNSYSIVEVAGGATTTIIGGLVGRRAMAANALIDNSYWDSQISGQDTSDGGSGKTTVELQEPTTNEGIYASWSPGNWDFGSSIQFPILKAFGSDTLLPNQRIGLRSLQTSTTGAEFVPTFREAITRYTITIPSGTNSIDLTLAAYNSTATIEVIKAGGAIDYFAGMGSRGSVSIPIATTPVLIITVQEPELDPTVYQIVATSLPLCALNIPDDNDGVEQAIDIDKDGDGLIEICDLEGLDEMRHQFDGTGYRTTLNATVITTGCPFGGCTGYELTRSLDFRDDNSYRAGSINTAWTTNDGWLPIENTTNDFSATFDGNGHTISNLMINREGASDIGLFGVVSGSKIANIGLLDVDITGNNDVGGLVGESGSGTITNSYVTGSVSGDGNNVGGLVGSNGDTITNSYVAGSVSGDARVGGLVGNNFSASITSSYATGSVSGASNIGGLVGENSQASITNSYTTSEVMGSGANVGGLVGNNGGTITGSYWLRSSASSGGTGVNTNTSRTETMLISPTTATEIYATWNLDARAWDFGSRVQYPALRYVKGTDTNNPACSDTPPQTSSDRPQCETLLLNQEVSTGILIRVKVFLEGPLQ